MKTKIFTSIQDVPKDQWNGLLAGHSYSFAYEFWEVIEKSGLNDFQYRYVLFYDDADTPIGLTSFYSVTTDIAIFASGALKSLLNMIRSIFPNFLKLRMLECGTPITINSPPFVTDGKVPEHEIITAIDTLLMKTAKAEKQLLIVIRDFEANAECLEPSLAKLGYCSVGSLPNTYMDILWPSPQEYLASMKSYYRSKLLRHMRKCEQQEFRHELVYDFDDRADILCNQWLVVYNKAKEFQREILTPEFYRQFSTKMGSRSKALLFYQKDRLVGHALLFMDGELMRWLYFGRTDAFNDSLYIYVAHKVIETAIMSGAKRLELGLTTYSIKQDLGAQATSIKLALKSRFSIINPLIEFVYPLINHVPGIQNKNIFKDGDREDDTA